MTAGRRCCLLPAAALVAGSDDLSAGARGEGSQLYQDDTLDRLIVPTGLDPAQWLSGSLLTYRGRDLKLTGDWDRTLLFFEKMEWARADEQCSDRN
jgi:hypothetical protein